MAVKFEISGTYVKYRMCESFRVERSNQLKAGFSLDLNLTQ